MTGEKKPSLMNTLKAFIGRDIDILVNDELADDINGCHNCISKLDAEGKSFIATLCRPHFYHLVYDLYEGYAAPIKDNERPRIKRYSREPN